MQICDPAQANIEPVVYGDIDRVLARGVNTGERERVSVCQLAVFFIADDSACVFFLVYQGLKTLVRLTHVQSAQFGTVAIYIRGQKGTMIRNLASDVSEHSMERVVQTIVLQFSVYKVLHHRIHYPIATSNVTVAA